MTAPAEKPDRDALIRRLERAALPDPHDEREVMHAPLLREAAKALAGAPPAAVPREPTEAMTIAGCKAIDWTRGDRLDAAAAWRAMYDAAPAASPAIAQAEPVTAEVFETARRIARQKIADTATPAEPIAAIAQAEQSTVTRNLRATADTAIAPDALIDSGRAALQSILRAGLSHAEYLRAWPMIEAMSAQVSQLDTLARGYYNEVADGWIKFRAAEREIAAMRAATGDDARDRRIETLEAACKTGLQYVEAVAFNASGAKRKNYADAASTIRAALAAQAHGEGAGK